MLLIPVGFIDPIENLILLNAVAVSILLLEVILYCVTEGTPVPYLVL